MSATSLNNITLLCSHQFPNITSILPGRVPPMLLCIKATEMSVPRRCLRQLPVLRVRGPPVASVQRCGAPFPNTPAHFVTWAPKRFRLSPPSHGVLLEQFLQFISCVLFLPSQLKGPWERRTLLCPRPLHASGPSPDSCHVPEALARMKRRK